MTKQKKCPSCSEEYIIKENKLPNVKEKQLEKAICPSCSTEIYSEVISGWFFVKKTSHKKVNVKCKYPMP